MIAAHGGDVRLDSGEQGTTIVRGIIDVSGHGIEQSAGTIHVLGHHVGLFDNAQINATAAVGAGTVLIGGDYQGKNAAIRNAVRTFVGANVVIRADANTAGDGGKVVVWADDITRFYGAITARGGSQSGDGGFVEVSGKENLDYRGMVDLTAATGNVGQLLLDPLVLNIIPGALGPDNGLLDVLGGDFDIDFPDGGLLPASITALHLQAQLNLNLSNITLQATSAINVLAPILAPASTVGLQFDAPAINLTGGTITTGGTQTYNGAVTLGAITTITGSSVEFAQTLAGGGFGLTVSSAGTTRFGGAVSGLNTLETDLLGTTQLNGNVTTSGLQTYNDDVRIDNPLTLMTTNSAVSFEGTVDSQPAENNALTVTAGTGDITFTGAVGAMRALGAIIANSTNLTRFNSTVESASLTTNLLGTTQLNGNVTTSGLQTYNDDVRIDNPLTLMTTNSAVSFEGTVDSQPAENNALTVTAGTGDITFTGAVGGAVALSSLDVDGNNIALANIGGAAAGVTGVTDLSALNQLTFTGTTYRTAGTQTFAAAAGNNFLVDGGAPTSFTTTNDAITFNTANILLANGSDLNVTSDGGAISMLGIIPAAAGIDVTLNASRTAPAQNGGDILLGSLIGPFFLNDLVIDSQGGDGGDAGKIPLAINLLVDANGADLGSVTLAGDVRLMTVVLIDTEQVGGGGFDDAAGGAVALGNAIVSANAVGLDLSLNSATTLAGAPGGAVTLGTFANAAGQFVNDLTVTTMPGFGGTAGIVILNGDIRLDDSNGPVLGGMPAALTLTGATDVHLENNVTIDTEQGDDAAAGAINFAGMAVSANAVGRDLILNTATTAAGANSGAVTLGRFANAAGQFVNALTIVTTPGAGGAVTEFQDDIVTSALVDVTTHAIRAHGVPANKIEITARASNGMIILDVAPGATANSPDNYDLQDVLLVTGDGGITSGGQITEAIFAFDAVMDRFTALDTSNVSAPPPALTASQRTVTIQLRAADADGTDYGLTLDWLETTGRYDSEIIDGTAVDIYTPFMHTYTENPSPNPAADIPMMVYVASLANNTIQPSIGGRQLVGFDQLTGMVPADVIGISTTLVIDVLSLPAVMPVIPPASLPSNPPASPVIVANLELATAPIQRMTIHYAAASAGVTSTGEERYYELRIVSFDDDGHLEEKEEAKVRLDDRRLKAIFPFNPSKLPALFGRLPADRYRIYLIEDGAERLMLEFTIEQGQPIEIPEVNAVEPEAGGAVDPFMDDAADIPSLEGSQLSGESRDESKQAQSFAERLGNASFISHGGVVVGAAAVAYAGSDRWEKSIDRLMERFDRRRRLPEWRLRTKSESQASDAAARDSVHLLS
jgi:hypothetical protein